MGNLEYTYKGKIWRSCPTAAGSNSFFNAVFGTRNSNNQPYLDKAAKFRRMYWSSFLTYYSDKKLPGALFELLKSNSRYQQKRFNKSRDYAEYMADIAASKYCVLKEEIPLLATLANVTIVLFIERSHEPKVFHPNPMLLDDFPFRSFDAVREVVICLVGNHFSLLQPNQINSGKSNVISAKNQNLNKKGARGTRKKTYKKRGSAGIEGINYQINLLTMVLLNGIKKVGRWYLSTENEDAGKFDDLVFEYLPPAVSKWQAILLQAKYKIDETKKVTCDDLVSIKNDFSLPKYFFSYQEILNSTKFNVQNIVICTNLDLDEDVKRDSEEKELPRENVLHFEGIDNSCYSLSCSMPKLKENIEEYGKVHKKGITITDEAIAEFLKHLQFLPKYLCKKSLNRIIEKTVSEVPLSIHLDNNASFKGIRKKMSDWFEEDKGRYLTEVEGKGFFCDIRSNKYCDDLKLYDISFEENKLLKDLKRISHIIPDKEYILNVIKVYQALQSAHNTKALFVDPDESIDIQMQTIDAFMVEYYTILVIACNKPIEENAAIEMCSKVTKILSIADYKYKHVILIAEKESNLAIQMKNSNTNYYEAITDSITFSDVEIKTQEEFKKKKLTNFQGSRMSLEELFRSSTNDELNRTVDTEVLLKLARGDEIKVGMALKHRVKYYIDRTFKRNNNIPEEDMCRPDRIREEKVVLISDSAGMGKSTVLTSLATTMKQYNPYLWVVRADLNNYTEIMKASLKTGAKTISILEILESKKETKLESEFEKKLFKNRERVVLMLDGVDEVSPNYTELVTNLVKDSVIQPNLAKVLVTTRPHLCKELEQVMGVQSFTLIPFSEENQIDFLTKYWTYRLNLQGDIEKRKCESYAKVVIREMTKWIGRNNVANTFAGIPLQTRMLAEIFQGEESKDWEGCENFLKSSHEEPKLPEKINFTQLYEMFIEKKRDIFVRDKNNSSGAVTVEAALNEKFEKCQEYHRSLALKLIFDCDKWELFTCHKYLDGSDLTDYLLRVGIIQLQGEELNFIHRTFAEYFAAKCMLIELKSEPLNAQLYQSVIYELKNTHYKYDVVLVFFDHFLKNEPVSVKIKIFGGFWSSDNKRDILSCIFYASALKGCAEILRSFLEFVKMTRAQFQGLEVQLMTWLNYATVEGHLHIVKLLVENAREMDTVRSLHIHQALPNAIRGQHLHIIKFVVEEFDVNVNKINILDMSILEFASAVGCLTIVKYLVKQGANKDNRALNAAAFYGRLSVVKYLAEYVDVNAEDSYGSTALHAAILGGQLDSVKLLVEELNANVSDIRISSEMIFRSLKAIKRFGSLLPNHTLLLEETDKIEGFLRVAKFMANKNYQVEESLEEMRSKLSSSRVMRKDFGI